VDLPEATLCVWKCRQMLPSAQAWHGHLSHGEPGALKTKGRVMSEQQGMAGGFKDWLHYGKKGNV